MIYIPEIYALFSIASWNYEGVDDNHKPNKKQDEAHEPECSHVC